MKVRDVIYRLKEGQYIGIKSLDCDEVFCLGNTRSEKLKTFYDREVLLFGVETTTVIGEGDKNCPLNYLEIIIQHKKMLTVFEAVDKVLRETTGYMEDDYEALAITNHRVDLLLEIKRRNYSGEELLELHDLYASRVRRDPTVVSDFDALFVYSQVLLELELIPKH